MASDSIALLRERHPAAMKAIEAAPLGEPRVVVGPRGAVTLSASGVLLASAYDPVGEGERLAAEWTQDEADAVVLIGYALGHHIDAYRRMRRCPIIVFEPSTARMRAALEVRGDAGALVDDDVELCVDTEQLGALIRKHYQTGTRLRVHVHPSVMRLDTPACRTAVDRVSRAKDTLDITVATLVSMMERWAWLTVENTPHLVRSTGLSRIVDAFPGATAVVCAAGPSLDKQLPIIRRERGRLLVIAIGQTLRALREAGIEPDVVHILESADVVHQLTGAGDTSNLSLVLTPSVHEGLFQVPVRARFIAWPAPNVVAVWMAEALGERGGLIQGAGTVAQSAIYLAARLGATRILVVGQDLAFSNGRAYASGSAYGQMGFELTGNGRFVFTNLKSKADQFGIPVAAGPGPEEELVWVEGWDGERVPTSVPYSTFIEDYRDLTPEMRAIGVEVVNCTEGGALLPGLRHAGLEEMLREIPEAPVCAAPALHAAHDSAEDMGTDAFGPALVRARRALERVEALAKRGGTSVERARRTLQEGESDDCVRISRLRGVVRAEKKLRRGLEELPWLDALVQPEVQQLGAVFGTAARANPTPVEVMEESGFLFEATRRGVARARALLDRLEERLGEFEPDDKDA